MPPTPFPPNGKTPMPVNMGPINNMPRDRFGAVIRTVSLVLYEPEVALVMRVVEVGSGIDTRIPAGMVKVTIGCEPFTLLVPANSPLIRMVSLQAGPEPAVEPDVADDDPKVSLE